MTIGLEDKTPNLIFLCVVRHAGSGHNTETFEVVYRSTVRQAPEIGPMFLNSFTNQIEMHLVKTIFIKTYPNLPVRIG
ncbi:MAG: hypothetical protein GF334_11840 [Candidatus Altiarchaeales archaeon]|nr:hypothetical protein [Candidatus Altiarchaeales archaeon]